MNQTDQPLPQHRIINRGRGPEIEGTRITIYSILDLYLLGWHHTTIASWFNLSSFQVMTAIKYIEEHKEEVMSNYQKILDRCARGNPPEIQAKLDATHAKYEVLWADRIRRMKERRNNDEGNSCGQ